MGGDGTRSRKYNFVKVFSDAQAISAGEWHSMVMKTDGTVWATGYNSNGQLGNGQLGNGTLYLERKFTTVFSDAQAISAGGGHSMVLKTDGTVWATGDNSFGQLGDGTRSRKRNFVKVFSDAQA